MKVYFVNFLLSLAYVVVLPAPAPQQPQQMGNIGLPYFGPFTAMFDLASLLPTSFLSTAENMVQSIPIVNMVPATIETGIQMGENIAKIMDSKISTLEMSRGVPHLPQPVNPEAYFGQTGFRPAAWPSNFPSPQVNEFSPVVPALPPFSAPFSAPPPAAPAMPTFAAQPSAVPAPPAMSAYDNLSQVSADSNVQSPKPSGEHHNVKKSTNVHKAVSKSAKKTVHKH